MQKVNENEMRTVGASGASKYVTCPICGYVRKSTIVERLFGSNTRIQYSMTSHHYKIASGYNGSQSVHY